MQGVHSLYHVRDAAIRLTLVRENLHSDVFLALSQLLDEIEYGDNPDSLVSIYHEFVSCVLELEDAVVTGDRWKDHILAIALQSDTAFTRSAVLGGRDEVLIRAQMRDLYVLEQLFSITDESLINWMAERQQVDARSWTRWSVSGRTADYGEGPIADARRLLCESEDWSVCAQALWDFHRRHGSGLLLSSNRFLLTDQLFALPRFNSRPLELEDIWPEYGVLAENVRRLLFGNSAENIIIAAEDGQKFAVQSLLPLQEDLRMIEFNKGEGLLWRDRPGLLREIEDLPGANLVYVDMRGEDISALADLPPAQGNTILCIAVDDIENPPKEAIFLHMPMLPEIDFNHLVERFAKQLDSRINQEHIQQELRHQRPRQYSIESAQQVAEHIIKILALDGRKGYGYNKE